MAISEEVKKRYLPSIGIETHVQLNTKTKLFSASGNDAREASPNSLISHIDAGMPGALPVLNRAAIEECIRAALALNTQAQKFSRFERKHYFYPDLPKGYQITQYEDPIIKGGYLDMPSADGGFKVEIERANLEEDAGKNTHPDGADYTLVDLNRAGTPLLEIVSNPDIHSPAQAKAFAREIWLTMKYAGVTDGDLYLGQVRFDLNVSVSKETGKLGIRSEIKNLNSFRSVENAAAYEIERQVELLEKGQPVIQETRGWDEAKQKSTSQRGKEEARDYRYMPEPDIPPLDLDDEFMASASKDMPQLPPDIRKILTDIGLTERVVEDILDKQSIAETVLDVKTKGTKTDARRAAFWLLEGWPSDDQGIHLNPEATITLSGMLNDNLLSSTAATIAFKKAVETGKDIKTIIDEENLMQISDEAEIEKIVAEVLAQNQKAIEDVKNGETKAISFLVGQVMAKSQGKANPQLAREIIEKQLGS